MLSRKVSKVCLYMIACYVPRYWLDISICSSSSKSKSPALCASCVSNTMRRWKFRKYFPHFHISIHPSIAFLHRNCHITQCLRLCVSRIAHTHQPRGLFIIFAKRTLLPSMCVCMYILVLLGHYQTKRINQQHVVVGFVVVTPQHQVWGCTIIRLPITLTIV